MGCAEAIEATVVGTRRLVRKQDTWFRRDARVHWLDADQDADGTPLLTRALAVLEAQDTAAGDARP